MSKKTATNDIKHGDRYPFDASNDWWHSSGGKPPKPVDWMHAAARGIIANLQDRQGIKHELEVQKIDEETRRELVASLAEIIRVAGPRAIG
jgi:hypothetical protein